MVHLQEIMVLVKLSWYMYKLIDSVILIFLRAEDQVYWITMATPDSGCTEEFVDT